MGLSREEGGRKRGRIRKGRGLLLILYIEFQSFNFLGTIQ
jgi:hypothetical protein